MTLNKPPFTLSLYALVFILAFAALRWAVGGFDVSMFISAGTDYVNPAGVSAPIRVSEGQGYDGQFFYRLALDPFDYSSEKYGVTLDFPAYRSQRIMYPLLAWLFSFGGNPYMVPYTLLLVNILAFAGVFYFFLKITSHYKSDLLVSLLPMFLFGIYMSLSKDLSEVTELFFFSGMIFFLLKQQWNYFTLFATLTLLTRETSAVAILPLSVVLFFNGSIKNPFNRIKLAIPFLALLTWKFIVSEATASGNQIEGTGNFNLPLMGILPGLKANLDFSTREKLLQFIFWMAYFIWQFWFTGFVLQAIYKMRMKNPILKNPIAAVYLTWLVFALILSPAIYADDWSFVRVFSLWNMTGILLLAGFNIRPGNLFYAYSTIILLFTLTRLIIKA